jgi:hypothetical protein
MANPNRPESHIFANWVIRISRVLSFAPAPEAERLFSCHQS